MNGQFPVLPRWFRNEMWGWAMGVMVWNVQCGPVPRLCVQQRQRMEAVARRGPPAKYLTTEAKQGARRKAWNLYYWRK